MKGLLPLIFFALTVLPSRAQVEIFENINSPADEINPIISDNGKTMYFIRVFDERNAAGMRDPGDIWFSTWTDSAIWSTPERLPSPLNNDHFNGVFAVRQNGERIYLYEHYMPGGVAARTQGISTSMERSGNWTEPTRVDIRYFYNKSEHVSISISADGSIMLLSLESYGTMGAEDIYVSFNKGSEWSEPQNLGPTINTRFQEMTPYLAPDNRTLFFASNGHGGFGGRDIFVSKRLDDSWRNWSEPKNLGSGINSEGVELYFQYFPEDEQAVFTSTQNSDGYSDLRLVPLSLEKLETIMEDTLSITEPDVSIVVNEEGEGEEPETSLDLKIVGKVLDAREMQGIDASLFIRGEDWQKSFESDAEDGFEIDIPTHDVYKITVEAEGFVSLQEVLDVRTTEAATIGHEFELQPIAIGTTVKLNNVLFVRGSTELLETSYDELDLVVKMMKENPEMEIFLAGHTDNRGSARLNRILSQERVDEVIYYLTSHGIEEERLSGKGYGGSKPIASNETEETRRLNRRVEFRIEKY